MQTAFNQRVSICCKPNAPVYLNIYFNQPCLKETRMKRRGRLLHNLKCTISKQTTNEYFLQMLSYCQMVPLAFFSCTWTDLLLEWTPVLVFPNPNISFAWQYYSITIYNIQYIQYINYRITVRCWVLREGIRRQTEWSHDHRKLANLITQTTALSNSMKLNHAV